MKINMNKVCKIMVLSAILMFIAAVKSYAGSFGISAAPGSAEPNSTITISVSGNNATGRINLSGSNIRLNKSSVWVENNTQTVTGTLTGGDGQTATITAVAADLADSTTADDITGSRSATVQIKKKEVVVAQPTAPAQTTPQATSQQQAVSKPATNQNKQQNSKANTPAKQETKTEVPKENNIEDQGTKAEFGIASLYLFGVNANGEKTELVLSPEFNINTAEYTCNVNADIQKIEMDYDASEYKDLVNIEGLEKELISGENIILVNMKNTDGTEKNYKITIIKEMGEENKEVNLLAAVNNGDNNATTNISSNNSKKEKNINMPIGQFIAIQIGIIIIEGVIFSLLYCILNNKKKIKLYGKHTEKNAEVE